MFAKRRFSLQKGKALKQQFDILIADRNPHVRDFLRRELNAVGYRVQSAVSGLQAFQYITDNPVDLLIVDPDLPDSDSLSLLEKLATSLPLLPIVVHTLLSDNTYRKNKFGSFDIAAFVEKEAGSIEQLKKIVSEILGSDNSEEKA